MTAWLDYIDARRRMVHEWSAQGVNAEDISVRLEVDPEHVERIRSQSTEPLPGTARATVRELRTRISELEQQLHGSRDTPPVPPPPVTSDVRSLLAHIDPALCGCQHWVTRDPSVAPDQHDPRCVFSPESRR
jgi:DNA-binding transcriptional MerR regulator